MSVPRGPRVGAVLRSGPVERTRRSRWFHSERERRWWRGLRIGAWLVTLALLALGAWAVWLLQTGPDRAMAERCATGPWATGAITGAGGPGAAGIEQVVADSYLVQPALTRLALLELRATASGADDPELSRLAFVAVRAKPDRFVERLADVEVACAERAATSGLELDPPRWAIP